MGSIAMEEYELMKDSKYRVYVSAVDKALKNFEYTSEWADLISALGKLNKVLLNYMKFPVIPRRIKISKRLAQCMHPALPSGVHLKALETYDIIFKCMGTNRLSHELFIYSAGLFPLLGHAAMNVRPSLLTVYETHFVPLGERLRPGLSGFLSGVLPGLEEGSDHFERTTSLLEKVCEGVGPPHFYGCLWDCLAANTGIRLPAISFVLSHFNKKLSMEDQLYIMGTNIDVSALCAGVQDGSVLVQRSALDLLLVGFPMHNSQLVRSDMVRLVTAALVTILRRDMSLNRRLFAWLLGSEVNTSLLGAEHPLVKRPSSNSNYFDMYSRDMLIQAVKITLSQGLGQNPPDVRPYRLLVSLLDKQDIGPIILDDILFEVFRTLYLSCGDNDRTVGNGSAPTGSRSSSQEILKAANLLFSSLEPCYIWQYTGTLFSNACQSQPSNTNSLSQSSENSESSETRSSKGHVRPVGSGPPDLEEVCTLTEFLLDSVSLEAYVETPGEHLPGLFLYIVTQLTEGCGSISPSEVLARALWQHLGQLEPHLQMNCVELLHQLHNVLPASDAVEDIIGEALTQDGDDKKMEALQHFSLLWHLGRELEAKSGSSRTLRTFDRSLLKMLDHLQRPESCPLRLQAQAWLLHSLVRGDVARLLDPLLLLLLEPNTARLSVLHVSIQHSNTVVSGSDARTADGPDERASARIYAISSVDGNVIYHVSEDNSHRSGQQRMANDDPVRAKRIFAVTTLVGGDSAKHYITEKTPHLREIDFPTSFLARQNISVFVNPFAASHVSESAPEDECIPETRERSASMPDFLRHATRLHPPGRSLSGSTSEDAGPVEETEITASFQSRCTSDPDSPRERSAENDGSDSSSGSTEGADGSQGRSWSAVDDVLGEPEESTAAEDYFKNSAESSSVNVVQDILKEVLDKVAKQCAEDNEVRPNAGRPMSSGSLPATSVTTAVGVHPLHSHMLLYCGVYDSGRALYALRTLRAVLLTHARMFLCAAVATGLAGQQTAGRRAAGLQVLLARHRKSVFGRSFHGDLASLAMGEYSAAYRSSMYLEVLMSVCLYYSRSFYPNLGQMRLTPEEIAGNRQVQLASAELLMLICSELIVIVRDSGRGFACYLADLLVRCKVQKVVLHCVVASVYDMSCVGVKPSRRTFTEEIVSFNDPVIEHTDSVSKCRFRSSEHSEGFQIQLLRLLLALLMLEHQVSLQKGEDATTTPTTKESKESSTPTKNPHQKYTAGVAIPEQPMFLSGILSALKMEHMRHLHQQWTALVTSALPFMGSALTPVVMSVVSQLCCNLEKLSQFYNTQGHSGTEMICCLPPDYTVTQLESLTLLSHYCLLDSAQQQSHAFSQPLLGGVGSAGVGAPGAGPGQVFSNLVHVFMPSPLQETSTAKDKPGGLQDTLMTARLTMLSNLPRILASVASLWQAVLGTSEREQPSCVLGSARVVKHQLLELLSPISLHHGPYFLAAVAVAWQDRRPLSSSSVKVVPVAGPEQQVLVSLVGALRVLPMDTLVQTVHSVLRQPPPIQGAKQDLSLEVSLLELFYCCLKGCAGVQLAESWGSLLPLLRDGLTLSPPAQFLLLAVLSEYVHRCPPLAERKDQRDLQDITAKLVESCAQIAGACLEQTTWLRRNLAVREEEPVVPAGRDKDNGGVASTSLAAQFSVQAQSVLAELLAPLLDVSYGSQEKEKVVALLTALMYNITPYLKNHTRRNVPSFQACSQLLASLSSYQYTRKAWRKDVFDLLLDPSLFQMEAHCLPLWRTIVDNLMTHDNTTFRDLMSRVSLAQSGSLSIFSSREQEYEQRAQLLKRLAFVLLCSEMDQYHKYMPEIQERLADSLRLPQVVPTVQAQVFLCFRVLLLRMSSQHVTSLWPIIISELVQVFLHIEQELSTDSEEFSNNGLHAHGHPAWLQLQLSAAKLLDLALALPAHRLPQFQMYRWAFVGGSECPSLNNNQPHDEPARSPDFVPHVARIARLMDTKFGGVVDPLPRLPGQLLLRSSSIRTMQELHPFFTSLSTFSTSPTLPEWSSSLGQLEAALETDFLERLPNK
ncbi:Uncharacterized protein GBIM_03458 [Gryllus bimaculatus]|nr:Uncharacterized protein GBIM_03458 [Gryllus bimaculatus]